MHRALSILFVGLTACTTTIMLDNCPPGTTQCVAESGSGSNLGSGSGSGCVDANGSDCGSGY